MKISISSLGKTGSCFTGVVFAFAIIGTGSVGAETYQHGGSTATIHQSGGSGRSESQVTRYKDGQKIITRDGTNIDITIQREGRFIPPADSGEYPETGFDCFLRRYFEQRFLRIDSDEQSDGDCSNGKPSCASADFKQRMLDRTRSDFLP